MSQEKTDDIIIVLILETNIKITTRGQFAKDYESLPSRAKVGCPQVRKSHISKFVRFADLPQMSHFADFRFFGAQCDTRT